MCGKPRDEYLAKRARETERIRGSLHVSRAAAHEIAVCVGKTRYASESTAEKARRRKGALGVYECPVCGDWHLTMHPRKSDGAEKSARTVVLPVAKAENGSKKKGKR